MEGFDRQFGNGERRDTVDLYVYAEDGSLLDSIGPYSGVERFFHRTPQATFELTPIFGIELHAGSAGECIVIGNTERPTSGACRLRMV